MAETHSDQSLPIYSAVKWIARIYLAFSSVVGTLAILMAFGIFALLTSTESPLDSAEFFPKRTITSGSEDNIAVVFLNGVITDQEVSSDPFSAGGISSKKVINMLEEFRDDDSIKAVVLHVNTPGGAVVASDELYRKVLELKNKKPVVVSMGDVAASGGYYLASAANYVVANPATITGSIGVIAQFPKLSGLYDKVGLEMRTFKSGQFKDIGSESRDVSAEEQVILQTMINEAYDQFVAAIVTGRNLPEAEVRRLADGRIYTGKQAVENKLVDELGTVDTAIAKATELSGVEDPSVYEYSDQGFFESILSSRLPNFSSLNTLLPTHQSGVYYLMDL